jgi:ABC-type multidrug transport system ATPase subunit
MHEAVLEIRGLSKKFGDIQAVKDLNLTIYKGDVYGFIGPNGAGKTTTIRMVMSLIHSDAGTVRIFGHDLHRDFRKTIAQVGALVESPAFYPYLTGYRNMSLFGDLNGGVDDARIKEVLDMVGLGRRGKHRVRGYSHGMKQRLGIGLALLNRPKLLILDEPTNGLDPQGIREVRNLIRRISKEEEITIFLSSHLLSEMEMVTNRIGIMYRGTLITEGDMGQLLGGQEDRVEIKTDKEPEAKKFLEAKFPGLKPTIIKSGWLGFKKEKWDMAGINREMLQAGFVVESISARGRNLEDLFVELTGESKDVY